MSNQENEKLSESWLEYQEERKDYLEDFYKPECEHTFLLGGRCLKCNAPNPASGVTDYMTGKLPAKPEHVKLQEKWDNKLTGYFNERLDVYNKILEQPEKKLKFIDSAISRGQWNWITLWNEFFN